MVSSISTGEEFINLTMIANEEMFPIVDKKAGLVVDIIIPTAIIGVLLIVNGIVLIVIFMIRRRQKPVKDEFEELKEMTTVPREIIGDSPIASHRESLLQPTGSKQNSPKDSKVQPTPRENEAQATNSKQSSLQSSPINAEPTPSMQNLPQSSPIKAKPTTSKQNSPHSSPIEEKPTTSKQNSPQSSPIKTESTASK